MHKGEAGYYACVFAAASGYQITVILSDEKSFTDANQKGYQPLSGFGDRARVAHGGIDHVDVMKGKTFCEVLDSMPDDQFTEPDWTHAAGKICVGAFATR